jgi:hypothetical protein
MTCEDCEDPLSTLRKVQQLIIQMAAERGLKLEGFQISPTERGKDTLTMLLSINIANAEHADEDWADVLETLERNEITPQQENTDE